MVDKQEVMELQMSEAVEAIIIDLTSYKSSEKALSKFLTVIIEYGLDPQKIINTIQSECERVNRESKH